MTKNGHFLPDLLKDIKQSKDFEALEKLVTENGAEVIENFEDRRMYSLPIPNSPYKMIITAEAISTESLAVGGIVVEHYLPTPMIKIRMGEAPGNYF